MIEAMATLLAFAVDEAEDTNHHNGMIRIHWIQEYSGIRYLSSSTSIEINGASSSRLEETWTGNVHVPEYTGLDYHTLSRTREKNRRRKEKKLPIGWNDPVDAVILPRVTIPPPWLKVSGPPWV